MAFDLSKKPKAELFKKDSHSPSFAKTLNIPKGTDETPLVYIPLEDSP